MWREKVSVWGEEIAYTPVSKTIFLRTKNEIGKKNEIRVIVEWTLHGGGRSVKYRTELLHTIIKFKLKNKMKIMPFSH